MRALATPAGIALILAGCAGREAAPPSAEREAVLAVLREQEESWNRGDLEAFARGYLDSPNVTFFTGSTALRGHAALLERYRKRYASEGREMGRLSFGELEVEVLSPTAAITRGRWRLKTSKEELGGLFTLVFRKSSSGWRIVHDHTS
jgi:beta-aspartyl-peptidase (threonine type)